MPSFPLSDSIFIISTLSHKNGPYQGKWGISNAKDLIKTYGVIPINRGIIKEYDDASVYNLSCLANKER